MTVQARRQESAEERVTPLELFFDLIFVFAITQVTGLVVEHPTWGGLVQGLLVLGVLWWAWAAYAWLTNTINPEEGVGPPGDVRRDGRDADRVAGGSGRLRRRRASSSPAPTPSSGLRTSCSMPSRAGATATCSARSRRLALGSVTGVGLLFVAAGLDGKPQVTVWAIALAIDLLGAYIGGGRGWSLAAGHFAERHALIVIIALGETIVALGVGATTDLSAGVIVAALLGLAIAGSLWWAYFDVVAIVAERRLRETEGNAQLAMARDSYSYLHLPMVAGIILFAVGVKKTLGDVGEPLKLIPAVALCGGVAMYLVAHVLFRLRNVRTFNRHRSIVSVLLLALIPVAVELPALATLAVVAGLCVGLIAYEAIRFAEARDRVRHAAEPAT